MGRLLTALMGLFILITGIGVRAAPAYLQRLPEDEVIYFVLPDRFANGDRTNDHGGLAGGKAVDGFDPTDKGYYHGGDLKGLTEHLGYIQDLGATAIWVGPIFKNKAVQGDSAGYHGYWITDFTRVDPHFGTNADFKALVEAAHARGMKVYMDIVVNHTADVIQYQDCVGQPCPYRSIADYPYTRRGGVDGAPINPGFMGDDEAHQTPENFAHLARPDYAYTPFIPKGEEHLKVPDWLNNPIYYHNRGDTTYKGESSTYGDFSGLDDLFTENPRVVQGFIDIYGTWISDYHIDGFRIDTAKHVNGEFWAKFVPAMLARAQAAGIPHFHIFGEVSDPEFSPAFAKTHHLPALLDWKLFEGVKQVVAEGRAPSQLNRAFWDDALWPHGEDGARQLATFIGNHDDGRFAMFVRKANPKASKDELEKRTLLGYAMLLTLRGVPVIYAGDEQGFIGIGGDKDARQDMFGSNVASYNADMLLGSNANTATPRFDRTHPFYQALAELNRIRRESLALRRGDQIFRTSGEAPGLIAFSRKVAGVPGETLVAFNTSAAPITAQVLVDSASTRWHALHGDCAATSSAPGSMRVQLAGFDYLICTTGH